MVQVSEDEVLLPSFSGRGRDAGVDLEEHVLVRSHGLGADVQDFAEAEAGAKGVGVGRAEDW